MIASTPSLLGRRITRFKPPFFAHDGTCADDSCRLVVDTIPGADVRLTTIANYADGWTVAIRPGISTRSAQERAHTAMRLVGTAPYDWWRFNCQHLAEFIETGNTSGQDTVQRAIIVGLAFTVLAIWAANA